MKWDRIVLVLFAILCLWLLISPVSAWYDANYQKRKPITITNPPGVPYYQVCVNVTYDADMQADFDDLRFVDNDDTTLLDHWVEAKVDSSFALVWVELKDTIKSNYCKVG